MSDNLDHPLTQEERILIERLRRVRRLRELDGPEVIVQRGVELVDRSIRDMLGEGWRDDVAGQHARDLKAAAGECMVPLPEPGTPLARVVRANALLRRERDEMLSRVQYLLKPDADDLEDVDGIDRFPTIAERLGDDLFCHRAARFIAGTEDPDAT